MNEIKKDALRAAILNAGGTPAVPVNALNVSIRVEGHSTKRAGRPRSQ